RRPSGHGCVFGTPRVRAGTRSPRWNLVGAQSPRVHPVHRIRLRKDIEPAADANRIRRDESTAVRVVVSVAVVVKVRFLVVPVALETQRTRDIAAPCRFHLAPGSVSCTPRDGTGRVDHLPYRTDVIGDDGVHAVVLDERERNVATWFEDPGGPRTGAGEGVNGDVPIPHEGLRL